MNGHLRKVNDFYRRPPILLTLPQNSSLLFLLKIYKLISGCFKKISNEVCVQSGFLFMCIRFSWQWQKFKWFSNLNFGKLKYVSYRIDDDDDDDDDDIVIFKKTIKTVAFFWGNCTSYSFYNWHTIQKYSKYMYMCYLLRYWVKGLDVKI